MVQTIVRTLLTHNTPNPGSNRASQTAEAEYQTSSHLMTERECLQKATDTTVLQHTHGDNQAPHDPRLEENLRIEMIT